MAEQYRILRISLDKPVSICYRGYMLRDKSKKIMDPESVFLFPANSTHRQYEALRAVFVDGLSPKEAAEL